MPKIHVNQDSPFNDISIVENDRGAWQAYTGHVPYIVGYCEEVSIYFHYMSMQSGTYHYLIVCGRVDDFLRFESLVITRELMIRLDEVLNESIDRLLNQKAISLTSR